MPRRLVHRLVHALPIALVLQLAPSAHADTYYVRELARNKPRTLIVVSGPEAAGVGKILQERIYRFPDWGKRKREELAVLPLTEAAERLKAWGPRTSVIFLLAGRELAPGALPAGLSGLLPLETGVLGARTSALRTVNDLSKAGEIVVRAGLYAPDTERLQRLLEVFASRRVGSFRELPFGVTHESNRLALFSTPELRPSLMGWGKLGGSVWDDIRWYPLDQAAALSERETTERARLFFTDRQTTPLAALPAEAAQLLASVRIQPTTLAVTSRGGPEPVIAVSAPTTRLLKTLLAKQPTLSVLTQRTGTREFPDLTQLGSSPLLVARATRQASPETTEAIHTHLAQTLRTQGFLIEPRGAVLLQIEGELAAQMAQGASDTRGALRKATSRYVWVLSLTELTGRTLYRASERKLTREQESFESVEPERPRRRRDESARDFQERYEEWETRWRQWERARRDWQERYDNAPCDWELTVTAESTTRFRGLLELVDTKHPDGPRPIWSTECRGEADESRPYRQQRATLKGHGSRPGALAAPPAREEAPHELLLAAAQRALGSSLVHLGEEAVLPEAGLDLTAGNAPVPPSESPLFVGKVADILGQTLTLNIGSQRGVKVGDLFEVLLVFRETRDPDTGRVIRLRVMESLKVRVTEVDKEACDAVPVSPTDAARLSKVTIGLPVRPAS